MAIGLLRTRGMRAKSKKQQLLAAPDERRQSCRLPITEPVHYKMAGRGKGGEQIGSGRTLNMSGNGVLFTTECFLAEGSRIELAVNWPVRLDGVALKLVVMGRVVW